MTDARTILVTKGRDSGDFTVPNPPTYRTSTVLFPSAEAYEDANHGKGALPAYGRYGTPTTWQLEEVLNTLQDYDATFLTTTGMNAVALAMQSFLKAGDHALVVDCAYGGTHPFCNGFLTRYGVEVTYFDPALDAAGLTALIRPDTKLLYLEAPGSLTFEMQDIGPLADAARAKGCVVVMDCTWATPLYFKPFAHGVDVVVHALTKYVGGHSDLMMGSVSCKATHAEAIRNMYKWTGPTPAGDNVSLALRGIRSMSVRLEHQQQSALSVARWLKARPEIKSVLFPMLPEDAHHALWKKYMTGGASLFSIETHQQDEKKIFAMIDALEHFGIGASWGGYESLIIPFRPAEMRQATTWDKHVTLLRLHIGLEYPDDLIHDLEQALTHLAR